MFCFCCLAKLRRSPRRLWRSCLLRLCQRLWLQPKHLKRNQWRCTAWERWLTGKGFGSFRRPFAFQVPFFCCGIFEACDFVPDSFSWLQSWFPWVFRDCRGFQCHAFTEGTARKANQKTPAKPCRCLQRCPWMYHPTRQGSWGWRNSKVSREKGLRETEGYPIWRFFLQAR